MTLTLVEQAPPGGARRATALLIAVGLVLIGLFFLAVAVVRPGSYGLLLTAAVLALGLAMAGLGNPALATVYLLGATFFRLAIPSGTFPVDPFLPAFAGVVISVWIWSRPRSSQLPAVGLTELAVGLYIAWNVFSFLTPHPYAAIYPADGSAIPLARFILIGTAIPLTMFLVGRVVFVTPTAIRWLCLSLLAAGAYSVLVSILAFHGPRSFVWPSYVLSNTEWPGRAVGVFNQPVVNGLVLILCFLISVLLASQSSEPSLVRVVAVLMVLGSVYGIYLTHTRAVWASFALVLMLGAVLAKGFRRGFVLTLLVIAGTVAANWATFTSADRTSGGVASTNEIYDRLNTIATALWALDKRPLAGWGIGRFPAVNTYHHQQWSPEIPWNHGYGIVSHLDVLGIGVELGLIGLGLWLLLLGLFASGLWRALRVLPVEGLANRPFAVTATLAFVAMICTGLTVDMRFFDFPNIAVLLLVGAATGLAQRQSYPPAEVRGTVEGDGLFEVLERALGRRGPLAKMSQLSGPDDGGLR